MHIIKYISVSSFYLRIGVSISDISVAPKKDYPIQLPVTEALSFWKFWLKLYCVASCWVFLNAKRTEFC